MNLSLIKISTFFAVVLILGWFLYPRNFFLAYISEGQIELNQAEAYYLDYLKDHPTDKTAIERLSDLYSRMGTPEKALPFLERLYQHRHQDWDFANYYLEYLKNLNNAESLYQKQLDVAQRFLENKKTNPQLIENILDQALQYAQWKQRYSESYDILIKLAKIAKNPENYFYQMSLIDRSLKRTQELITYLQLTLTQNPNDVYARIELADIYRLTNQTDQASQLIQEGLKLDPENQDLLIASIDIDESQSQYNAAITTTKKLLALRLIGETEQKNFEQRLAYLYLRNKQNHEAISIFIKLLNQDLENKELWQDVITTFQELNRNREAVVYLKKYLEKFPEDKEQFKNLAALYLYELKDTSQDQLYYDYIKDTENLTFALDVSYLMDQKEKPLKSYKWLSAIVPLFSGSKQMVTLFIDSLIELKKYPEAINQIEMYLKHNKASEDMIIKAIELYALTQNRDKVHEFLNKLIKTHGHDFRTLKYVGRELYYIGATEQALTYLYQASEMEPHDLEVWFFIAEAHFALSQNKQGIQAAKTVVTLGEQSKKLIYEQQKMLLKSQGRIKFTRTVNRDYQETIEQHPKDPYVRLDYVEFLLAQKNKKPAELAVSEFKQQFPKNNELIWPTEAALAAHQQQWSQAIRLYEKILKKQPRNWYVRRDLAEALHQSRNWPLALIELEEIQKNTGNHYSVEKLIKSLREIHDNQVFAEFNYNDFGNEDYSKLNTGFSVHLNKILKLGSRFTYGHYNNGVISQQTQDVLVTLSHQVSSQLSLTLGAGAGFSPVRETPTAYAKLAYTPSQKINLTSDLYLRHLRSDLSSAVISGALEDDFNLNLQYLPTEKLGFTGKYNLNRTYLKSGASSLENTFEPSLNMRIIKKPYLSLGYQFSLSHIAPKKGFLNEVPLIPQTQSHYVTAYANHEFNNHLEWEGGVFLGQDFKRDLNLFKGDLWGVNTKVKWHLTKHLIVNSTYDYGEQTLTGISGQTHQVTFGLTGHWDSWVKPLKK